MRLWAGASIPLLTTRLLFLPFIFKINPAFLVRSFVAKSLMNAAVSMAAIGIGWVAPVDFRSLMLSMVPGGIVEVSLTAEPLRLAVPLVTTMHIGNVAGGAGLSAMESREA